MENSFIHSDRNIRKKTRSHEVKIFFFCQSLVIYRPMKVENERKINCSAIEIHFRMSIELMLVAQGEDLKSFNSMSEINELISIG